MNMTLLLTLVVPGVAALAILGVFVKVVMPRKKAVTIEERLTQFAERPRTLEELELEAPFMERVVKPVLAALRRSLGKLTPQQGAEKLRVMLVHAGNPYNMQAA